MESQKESRAAEGKLDQLISFAIGDDDYGVNIQTVKEVIRHREITRLPKAPAFVKGVINLRGDIIPILDLRERFGMEQKEYTGMTRVIVVEIDGRSIGTVVDSVSHVIRIDEGQIEPPPPCVGQITEEYIRGVGKVGEKLIVLLNIDRILTSEEKIELARLEAKKEALTAS
ncbi:MAG TPA: chemotaxis protein CheW [Spirochaetes bacterium]|nr:chemotaxis protein CheW [Spirochaetota bacterium]